MAAMGRHFAAGMRCLRPGAVRIVVMGLRVVRRYINHGAGYEEPCARNKSDPAAGEGQHIAERHDRAQHGGARRRQDKRAHQSITPVIHLAHEPHRRRKGPLLKARRAANSEPPF